MLLDILNLLKHHVNFKLYTLFCMNNVNMNTSYCLRDINYNIFLKVLVKILKRCVRTTTIGYFHNEPNGMSSYYYSF